MNWCFLWKLHIDHNNAYIGGPKKMAKLLERHIIEIACKNYIKFLTTFFQHIFIFTQYLCKTIGLPNVEMAVTWKLYVKTSNIVNTSNNSSVWYALWTAVIKQLPGWSVGSCASQTDKNYSSIKIFIWAIPLSKHRSCNYTWQCKIAKSSARATKNWDNRVTNRIWGRILSTTVLIDGRCRTSSVLQHLLQLLVFSAWSQVGITRGE